MSLLETVPDTDVLATPPLGRPDDCDPVEARGVLDAVAARMFGAPAQPLVVGRFILLERIGRGGMGVVYAAYDPQLDRKIAIKLLVAPGDDHARPDGDERLIREARAAARLDHPNVVTIHEVGAWQGRVFLAMEYVDGLTLKAWVAAAPRTPSETLAVFLQAGHGLAAAHAAGVVHRDFKPENVLVGHDGKVRVVDFGLARASARELETTSSEDARAHDTNLTHTGAIMGTPAYMAPEQHRGDPAGAAADQFAFCVALWESWFGARPFAGDTFATLAIAVLEGRITPPSGDAGVPTRLRRIVEQGLATDPTRRHPSMDALLQALAHDPGRRVRRIVLGAVVGMGLVGAGLVLGNATGATDPCGGGDARFAEVWNATRRAEIARAFSATQKSYAQSALSQVEQRLDARAKPWIEGHREACEATLVRREQSDELLDLRMACLDRRLAELRSLVDLLAAADTQTVTLAVRTLDGLAPIESCGDAAALRAPVPLPDEPAARAEIAAIQDDVTRGGQLRDLGRFATALEIGVTTVAEAEALGHAPTIADALVLLGSTQAHAGELDGARATLESAVWSAIAGRNARAHAAATTALLMITGHLQENVETGARWGEHARAVLRAQGDPPGQLAALEGNLGNLAMTRRDRAAALAHFRESVRLYEVALGPDHANVGRMLANVAVVLRQQGALDLAEHTHARVIDILEGSLGPGHPDLGPALSNWATVLHARGRLDEALVRYRAALAVGEASLDAKHPQLGHAHNNIGETMLELGDAAGAEQHLRAAIAIWEQALGPRHSLLASPYGLLGRSLLARAQTAEAIAALEHALALPISAAVDATQLAEDRFALAQALWDRVNERVRAQALAREARLTFAEAKPTRVAAIDLWLATHVAP